MEPKRNRRFGTGERDRSFDQPSACLVFGVYSGRPDSRRSRRGTSRIASYPRLTPLESGYEGSSGRRVESKAPNRACSERTRDADGFEREYHPDSHAGDAGDDAGLQVEERLGPGGLRPIRGVRDEKVDRSDLRVRFALGERKRVRERQTVHGRDDVEELRAAVPLLHVRVPTVSNVARCRLRPDRVDRQVRPVASRDCERYLTLLKKQIGVGQEPPGRLVIARRSTAVLSSQRRTGDVVERVRTVVERS